MASLRSRIVTMAIQVVAPIDMTLQVVQTARLGKFTNAANRAVSKELGLRRASHGMFTARRGKAGCRWSLGFITGREGVRFTFFFLLSGALLLRTDSGVVSLHAHDA